MNCPAIRYKRCGAHKSKPVRGWKCTYLQYSFVVDAVEMRFCCLKNCKNRETDKSLSFSLLKNDGVSFCQHMETRSGGPDDVVFCVQSTLNKIWSKMIIDWSLKPDFICFPTKRETAESAALIKDHFGLPEFLRNWWCSYDFLRAAVLNVEARQFRNCKLKFSLNVMVIWDIFHQIRHKFHFHNYRLSFFP